MRPRDILSGLTKKNAFAQKRIVKPGWQRPVKKR
jgi:hypothetical protein